MIVNKVCIDYLRLTTWDNGVAKLIERDYSNTTLIDDTEPITRMQYQGILYKTDDGSASFLVGEQRGEKHYMLEFSGQEADNVMQFACRVLSDNRDKRWNVTRIDIQTTIKATEKEYRDMPDDFYKQLKLNNWLFYSGRGGKVSCRLIKSNTDTLYVGARTSEQMLRYYVKSDEDDNKYIRWEWELKGDRALWAVGELSKNGQGMKDSVFLHLLTRVSPVYASFYTRHQEIAERSIGSDLEPFQAKEVVRDTMAYLEGLTGTIYRVLADHSTSERAKKWVQNLYNMSSDLDNGQDDD